MSWLDISSFVMGQMWLVFFVSIILFLVSCSAIAVIIELTDDQAGWRTHLKVIAVSVVLWMFSVAICLMPTHDRVLAVKIAKIKNEAVNKENVTKGIETLERIGEKLECKYLGCEKKD